MEENQPSESLDKPRQLDNFYAQNSEIAVVYHQNDMAFCSCENLHEHK